MKTSDFNYDYPPQLIAQSPTKIRDKSKMMVIDRKSKSVEHSIFKNFSKYIKSGDVVIANNSKVAAARLFGTKVGGREIELLVVEPYESKLGLWKCLIKRAKKIRIGEQFFFGMHAKATATMRDGDYLIVEFKGNALNLAMKHHGVPPLPPYIKKDGIETYTNNDVERYQTIYANKAGSAAAPTAGFHMSDTVVNAIKERGAFMEYVTLHVGIDTFLPVRVDDPKLHKMHGERIEISKKTATAIADAKNRGSKIIAIGTTTTRALESSALNAETDKKVTAIEFEGGKIAYGKWTTNLFILPGFEFKIVDALLTNFHQPKSTLLMMVSAFAEREFILECYKKAIHKPYRLFSYGDCMLIK